MCGEGIKADTSYPNKYGDKAEPRTYVVNLYIGNTSEDTISNSISLKYTSFFCTPYNSWVQISIVWSSLHLMKIALYAAVGSNKYTSNGDR